MHVDGQKSPRSEPCCQICITADGNITLLLTLAALTEIRLKAWVRANLLIIWISHRVPQEKALSETESSQ